MQTMQTSDKSMMQCQIMKHLKDMKKSNTSPCHNVCFRLMWFFASMVLVSFVLNEIWEMAQMSAYVVTVGHSWTSNLALCTQATLGDVEIVLGIYATNALATGDLGWGLRGRWNIYAAMAVQGLVYATLLKHAALSAGQWTYTEQMPIVPVLAAGLWPLLQMTFLPPLTVWIARR